MISGSFAKFEDTENIKKKINGYTFEHDLEGDTVTATIQLDKSFKIDDLDILQGIVIDYRMLTTSELTKQDDKYVIKKTTTPRPVWAEFQIVGNNLVRAFTGFDKDVALPILSHAIGGTQDYVKNVNFDLQKLYKERKGHWIGGIFDREGHMQKGTFYGNHIEKDDIIGNCWKNNKKSLLGFETDYFGETSKVRVTLEGSVQSYAETTDAKYIQFILDEISPYMVNAPRSRRKRIS